MAGKSVAAGRASGKPKPRPGRPGPTGADVDVSLRARVAELEAQVESLEEALGRQEPYVLDGYVVSVWPMPDGEYLATCPTMHASVQEGSRAAALAGLREAVSAVAEAFAKRGRLLPPKDVTHRCLA